MNLVSGISDGYHDPWWVYPLALGGLGVIGFFLWIVNRIIVHFFPWTRHAHTGIGNALMRVEANFMPGREHILEAREYDEVETDDQGDPPKAGRSTDRIQRSN